VSGESKAEAIVAEVGAIAEQLGAIPSPASIPLEVGGTLLSVVGPEAVKAFAWAFHKLFHSGSPKVVAIAAASVMNATVDTAATIDPDGEGRDV
jgi:hypothetical protein